MVLEPEMDDWSCPCQQKEQSWLRATSRCGWSLWDCSKPGCSFLFPQWYWNPEWRWTAPSSWRGKGVGSWHGGKGLETFDDSGIPDSYKQSKNLPPTSVSSLWMLYWKRYVFFGNWSTFFTGMGKVQGRGKAHMNTTSQTAKSIQRKKAKRQGWKLPLNLSFSHSSPLAQKTLSKQGQAPEVCHACQEALAVPKQDRTVAAILRPLLKFLCSGRNKDGFSCYHS